MKDTDEMGVTIKEDTASTCSEKYILVNLVITDDAFSPAAQVGLFFEAEDPMLVDNIDIPSRPKDKTVKIEPEPLPFVA